MYCLFVGDMSCLWSLEVNEWWIVLLLVLKLPPFLRLFDSAVEVDYAWRCLACRLVVVRIAARDSLSRRSKCIFV